VDSDSAALFRGVSIEGATDWNVTATDDPAAESRMRDEWWTSL